MSDGDYGSDAATGAPPTLERNAPRLDDGHEVIEDAIGDVLVEDAFVAKFLQIQLQALKFHALCVRYITKNKGAKVRLARLGTHGGKLGALDFDVVFSIWKRVVEAFELILERCAWHRKFSQG